MCIRDRGEPGPLRSALDPRLPVVGWSSQISKLAAPPLSATVVAIGVWRQLLLPTQMTAIGQVISFACSTGEHFELEDVLFGDVHICGGQSNMQFTLAQIGQ